MEDQDAPALEADQSEDVSEDQTEGQEQDAKDETDGEVEGQAEPKRETSKERRQRDKDLKARLREDADKARAEAAEAESRRQQIIQAGEQDAAPRERDFKDYTEYVAAKAVWAHTQRTTTRDAAAEDGKAAQARQRAEAIQSQEMALVAQDWQSQIKEAKGRYKDFDEVVLGQATPFTPDLAKIIMTSDHAADVAYAIAKDPAKFREISAMQPVEAARAIGRLEATLSQPARKTSQAPAPITPVKGGATPTRDPSRMNATEYAKWRENGGTF